jgi:hypothetical protein
MTTVNDSGTRIVVRVGEADINHRAAASPHAGNITSAWVVASNAPAEMRARAAIAKGFYGDLVQVCTGTGDHEKIQAAVNAANHVVLTEKWSNLERK